MKWLLVEGIRACNSERSAGMAIWPPRPRQHSRRIAAIRRFVDTESELDALIGHPARKWGVAIIGRMARSGSQIT
jgi:hypothetical protein